MRPLWPILASTLLFACFRHHERSEPGSDGGVPDAGECVVNEGAISGLECPARARPGEVVTIFFTNDNLGCCESGDARVSVRAERAGWELTSEWTACGCSADRCIRPSERDSVDLGPLEPGTYTVRADAGSCTFIVEEPTCASVRPTELRAPAVLFEGQPFAFSVVDRRRIGCGCLPQMTAMDGRYEGVTTLTSTGPCEDCFCDYGFGYFGDAPTERPRFNGDDLPTAMHFGVDSCAPVEATLLEIVPPEEDVLRVGPELWWARLEGFHATCCVEPLGGVIDRSLTPREFDLELRACVDVDCGCVPDGSVGAFEAWFPLGELAPGVHRIRAGSLETDLIVP
ncbi:MAG: hypothetical protein AAGE52_27460 [Myxococcota bacterium]